MSLKIYTLEAIKLKEKNIITASLIISVLILVIDKSFHQLCGVDFITSRYLFDLIFLSPIKKISFILVLFPFSIL